MMHLEENLISVRNRIANACKKVLRNPTEIKIVAVTKTLSADIIKQAYDIGITDFGENKVQELLTKIEKIPEDVHWNMIGHLQKNKVKYIAKFIDLIHSVDSFELALEISKYAEKYNRVIPVLIQVNTSGEISKFGSEPDNAIELVKKISDLKNTKISGLMTIGAFLEDPEQVRPCFKLLRNLKEEINKLSMDNVKLHELSMGMTNDFEVAIEEGATIIRIGTAIFGERNYS